MKIYLVSGNFYGRDDTKKYKLIRDRGGILFSYFFLNSPQWQTKKIFYDFIKGKWE